MPLLTPAERKAIDQEQAAIVKRGRARFINGHDATCTCPACMPANERRIRPAALLPNTDRLAPPA